MTPSRLLLWHRNQEVPSNPAPIRPETRRHDDQRRSHLTGGPPSASSSDTDTDTQCEAADTNEDGAVSEAEQLAYDLKNPASGAGSAALSILSALKAYASVDELGATS